MAQEPFIDYYKTFQISPRAGQKTIEGVYWLSAWRYHPDTKRMEMPINA